MSDYLNNKLSVNKKAIKDLKNKIIILSEQQGLLAEQIRHIRENNKQIKAEIKEKYGI